MQKQMIPAGMREMQPSADMPESAYARQYRRGGGRPGWLRDSGFKKRSHDALKSGSGPHGLRRGRVVCETRCRGGDRSVAVVLVGEGYDPDAGNGGISWPEQDSV